MENIQSTEGIDIEFDILEEGCGLMVSEPAVRDLDALLEDLSFLHGTGFIRQLKEIASHPSFYFVKGETNIYSTGGENSEDYENLLNAARKAVSHGFIVYILPNPKNFRSADFIFVRKGVYRLFDLKTIIGKNSVGNRLKESIGQSNRVLLNLTCDYNIRNLTVEIKRYFEMNLSANEVLVFTGNKEISIKRNIATSKGFLKMMMNSFKK